MDIHCRIKELRLTFTTGLFAVLILLSVGASVHGAEKPSNERPYLPCPSEWLEEANFFVERGMIPGALIMVETPEWGLRAGAVGRADLSSSELPGPGMRYRVGGVTRLMLSTVILQLEQEGKLALDHTIDMLLGEGMVRNGHKITLRECLKMRSGLYDYSRADSLLAPNGRRNGGYLPEEILYNVREQVKSESVSPGTEYIPSDTGYLLAGMVVEKCENKRLAQVFTERIFKPLVMRDSFFAESPDIPAPMARGYENMSEKPSDCTVYDPSILGASNGVVSTPFDTFRFLRDIFEERTLLTNRSYVLMSMMSNAQRDEDSYGLGILERLSRRGTWRGVETAIRGYSVSAGYYMDGRAFIAVFVNTGENAFVVEEIFRDVLRRVSGCPTDYSPSDNARIDGSANRIRLAWQSGFLYGDSYRVYVGTDRNLVLNAKPGHLEGITLIETDNRTYHADIRGLKPGRSYYWRVEASRTIPETEVTNARKWRENIRSRYPQMPWTSAQEHETISGPVYSFSLH